MQVEWKEEVPLILAHNLSLDAQVPKGCCGHYCAYSKQLKAHPLCNQIV